MRDLLFGTPIKKIFWISFFFLLLLSLIAFFVVKWFIDDENTNEQYNSSVALTDEDRNEIGRTVKGFFEIGLTWGVKKDMINDENYTQSFYQIDDYNDDTAYYTSRKVVYEKLKQQYIYSGSNLYYNDTKINMISENTSYDFVGSFAKNVDYNLPDEGYVFSVSSDKTLDAVKVSVDLASGYVTYFQTANDESWDGTIEVRESTLYDKGEVILVKENNTWKIYGMSGFLYSNMLATSVNADNDVPDVVYSNLETVDTLKVEG